METRADLIRLMKALSYGAKNSRLQTPIKTLREPDRVVKNPKDDELEGSKVVKVGLTKEKGWLYYIDADGDIARTPMKTGGNKGKKRQKVIVKEKVVQKVVEKPVEIKALPAPPDEKSAQVTEIKVEPAAQNVTIKIEQKPQDKKNPEMAKMKERIAQLEKALSLISKKGNEEKYSMLKGKIDEMKKNLS